MTHAFTPIPPTMHHSTTRLTHLQAHSFLSTFLATAENEPAYRPDSILTIRGPVSVSTSGSASLTLTDLKRILKGLEGKRVGGAHFKTDFGRGGRGDDNPNKEKGKKRGRYEPDRETGAAKRRRQEENELELDVSDGEAMIRIGDNVSDSGSGWQEPAAFELEQNDEDGDVKGVNEDRDPGAGLEQPENEQQEREMMEVEDERTGKKVDPRSDGAFGDKDRRREEKKARRKHEKVERAKSRMLKKNG